MKCVILAGGLGTRIAEETGARPKPMVEIGGRPILWHIMKIYSRHGSAASRCTSMRFSAMWKVTSDMCRK